MVLFFRWGLTLSVLGLALVLAVNTTLASLYSSGKFAWFIPFELKSHFTQWHPPPSQNQFLAVNRISAQRHPSLHSKHLSLHADLLLYSCFYPLSYSRNGDLFGISSIRLVLKPKLLLSYEWNEWNDPGLSQGSSAWPCFSTKSSFSLREED